MTSTKLIPTTPPGRLRALLRGRPDPILLLGAGASVTSGVPAAGPAVEMMAKYRWCLDHDRDLNDHRVTRADYWPWFLGQAWFDTDKGLADLYPLAVERLLHVAADRRRFFETLIDPGVEPREGYHALAELLHRRWITTVLTTNFDDRLQRAQQLLGRPHAIAAIKTPSDLVRFSSAPEIPQLVYLHGSIEHYTDKNSADEVMSLTPEIADRVRPMLPDHPIIVVGYRGNEASVMRNLFLDQIAPSQTFAHGVYWCTLDRGGSESLAPLVRELADAIGGNFSTVPIAGFDQLFDGELWSQMRDDGARPIGAADPTKTDPAPAFDMTPVDGATVNDLDTVLMFTRLKEYSAVIKQWAPDAFDADWTIEAAANFNLVRRIGGGYRPTLAGMLLFGRDVARHVPAARVTFEAEGPREWLAACFGEDVDMEGTDNAMARTASSVSGTLWAQLDALLDVLSRVNPQFRLKEETSRQVRSYAPLAIKEMVVNALAHRDYMRTDPVTVRATPEAITVTSPGGLVADVKLQLGDNDIESFVKGGGRNVKGYRNPVVADLLYGGGAMDHTGSGLADLWAETVANNGTAQFQPVDEDRAFEVAIGARPEAVDELTRTAVAAQTDVVRYAANLLVISDLPERVWHAGTRHTAAWRLRREADENDVYCPEGHVHGGRYYTLYDLKALNEAHQTPFDPGDVEALALDELLAMPGGSSIFIKLLSDHVVGHLRAVGLYHDPRYERSYYTRTDNEAERRITYKARFKRATRTVVRPRTKRDSDEVLWYEHKSLTFAVMAFGDSWALALTPGYAFTRNGFGRYIGREKTNKLSTTRAAKDFNANAYNDVTFWTAMISEGADGLFALRPNAGAALEAVAPTITLDARLPTTSFRADAFGDDPTFDEDDPFEAMAAELDQLAEEEDEDRTGEHAVFEGGADRSEDVQ